MDYQDIIDKIIELRDQVEEFAKDGKSFKLKPLLDQIKDLSDQAIIDDQQQLFDRISVYEYIAEYYEAIGRLQLSADCYDELISCCKEIIDENRSDYAPLETYYVRYVSNMYLLTGDESENLDEEIDQYCGQQGLDHKQTTLEYLKAGLKHDPVEDKEEYLNVIDEVTEEIYNQYHDNREDDDYEEKVTALKKKLLKEKYNIDWKSPTEYNA